MLFSKEERLPQKELESLMFERLKAEIERVYEKVPMYRRKFDEAGIAPRRLENLKDLAAFPFTTKSDLRDYYPLEAMAVPVEKLVRIHATSGTTGKPILAGYTRGDVDTWSELMARSLAGAGVREGDIIQNAFVYGLRTGGLGVHYGAERLGAVVIPASEGNVKRQIMLLEELKANVICATPSLALQIGSVMRESGIFKENLLLKTAIIGGEPWSENMRAEIEDLLNVSTIDIYGLSEMLGPGVGCECVESRSGPHIFMDHFIPEIINPSTGEVLPPGEKGELVLTSLTKEAFPLIRYRTRDISQLNPDPCRCGRTSWRMSRVMGRTDDLLFIRGANIFPSQIESVLLRHTEVEPRYLIEVERVKSLDTLTVTAEVSGAVFSLKKDELGSIEKRIEEDMLDLLGVKAVIRLVSPGSLSKQDPESRRVIDKREI